MNELNEKEQMILQLKWLIILHRQLQLASVDAQSVAEKSLEVIIAIGQLDKTPSAIRDIFDLMVQCSAMRKWLDNLTAKLAKQADAAQSSLLSTEGKRRKTDFLINQTFSLQSLPCGPPTNHLDQSD